MIVQVDPFLAYLSLAIIAGFAVLMVLIVKSSDEYSVEQTEKTADEFAGTIKDAHGPVTTWLWVSYVVLIIWAFAYLYLHWSDFQTFPLFVLNNIM